MHSGAITGVFYWQAFVASCSTVSFVANCSTVALCFPLLHTALPMSNRSWPRKKYTDFLEEVFLHEAAHTSLDSYHSTSKGWINAQLADNGNFISDYAKKYPAFHFF